MPKLPFVAGVAAVPITPLQEHLDARLYLGGYGGYMSRPAKGVHDSPFARALVLGNGSTSIVFVALDLVGMTNRHLSRLRAAIARRLEVPEGAVLVACTHTHAGPDLQGLWGGVAPDYARHLRIQAVRAAQEAAANQRAASLEAGTLEVNGHTINRRGWPMTDDLMTVLRARDARNNTIATLVNFAAHPTVTQKENLHISRDFPGALVDSLESLDGGLAVFVNADQGDVNPNVSGGFGEVQSYGESLTQQVAKAIKTMQKLEPPLVIETRDMEVPLANPRLRLPPGLILQAALMTARGLANLGALSWLAGRYAGQDRAFIFAGLDLMAQQPISVRNGEPYLRTCISRLMIGNGLDALAAPGEVLTRLGRPLRLRLKAPMTMFLGLTNDSLGYFVPADEWMSGRNGNYEETVSLGPQAAPSLDHAVRQLLSNRP